MHALTTLAFACGLATATLIGTPPSPSTGPSTGQSQDQATDQTTESKQKDAMPLGVFSVSLAVKDIKVSKAFYEKLNFKKVGGKLEQNWLILQNDTTTIGLFQGMFEENIMTFNPGWDKDKETLKEFKDVREIQKTLKERGIEMATEADETTKGPASFVLADPDGNTILFDQHVPSPKR